MASASSPLQIAGDDDDFDWEAAVQEIDVACQATAENPTSNCDEEMVLNSAHELRKKEKNDVRSSFSSTRQATLDRFIKVSSSDSRKSVGKVENLNGLCGNDSNGNDICEKNDGCVANCEDTEMLNGFVKIDPDAAKTWIYPVNLPRRDYQFSITRTALFSNTLVVLPTGLGKTLIAAVVMYNFFRWFPEGKIVFAAPSRPLVTQQIEACHKVVGIPQEWTIDLTGQTSPTRRAEFWKCKRVFFVTPQVFEKDIQSGSCLVKHLVCLVIDEAHRATGNYSYCVAVRELMDTPVQLRILALSATPGSKQQTIQQVINNLQISTLEYRNESDPDVQPYVHDKKIELIQVAMGDEAVEINDLLLEVIRPFAARLSTFGVLQKRDIQTFSPCDLLNSRDKFRQEPPVGLHHTNYGVIEGYFGVLITLYHVRKLLSSHGIRPAFEMLDEKLKQGSFARLMSRNEVLQKAKLLMEQTISHGAPSPKLAKMLEVLTDHFKVKDPKNSRVIIFSNFRGSVRDILNSLTNIGGIVKATEFIGQSSGKTLKGQSQKVQQAVLQKFRAGGYNVIVATSIGEEGLDIMEVDLVICFDANVSPLRMIQRMGRTGRKHAGRVVVLACEGSELKGYMRKQANSKTIKKHMINGGMNSFYFHSSPRMVPHVFKPEVQFLEMSIEEFVPRGKKIKDTDPVPSPACMNKLTNAEMDLLSRYFITSGQTAWKPSLIAFPHFQAFPSPVNKVLHSSRTGFLIDAMQHLQGLTYSRDSQSLSEEEDILDPCLRVVAEEPLDKIIEDSERSNDPSEEKLIKEVEGTGIETDEITKDVHIEDFHKPTLLSVSKRIKNDITASACHVLSEEKCDDPSEEKLIKDVEVTGIETEDIAKDVLVEDLNKPTLLSNSKQTENNTMASACHLIHDYDDHEENPVLSEGNPSSHPRSPEVENVHESSQCIPDSEDGEQFSGAEGILHTPNSNTMHKEMDFCDHIVHDSMPTTPAHESSDDFIDPELSPRLTNFIKSGVVPESPVNNPGTCNGDGGNVIRPALISSQNLYTEILRNSWKHEEKGLKDGSLGKMDVLCLSDEDIHSPVLQCNDNAGEACPSAIPVAKESQTPLAKLSHTSNSEDWLLDTGVKPETVEQQCKLRRLRKLGDLKRKIPPESGGRTGPGRKLRRDNHTSTKLVKGAKKLAKHAAVYIEEEAEVSSEGMESDDDDEDVVDNSSYEDSFIDDGINPTSASTQAGSSRPDMMAIYRRSLLSQSPFQSLANAATMVSPNSAVQSSRMDGSGSSSGTKHVNSPQTGLLSTGRNSQFASNGIPSETVQNNLECRKRKLSFYNQAHSVPTVNLDKEFSALSETACGNSSMKIAQRNEECGDAFEDDDLFYEGIDLDAVEKEATILLRKKLECLTPKTAALSEPIQQNFGILESPSFDLGI